MAVKVVDRIGGMYKACPSNNLCEFIQKINQVCPGLFAAIQECYGKNVFKSDGTKLEAAVSFISLSQGEKYNIECYRRAYEISCVFCIASRDGYVKIVQEIIKNSRYKDVTTDVLNKAFWMAASGGHVDVVEALMNSHRYQEVTIYALDKAVLEAKQAGHKKVVDVLKAGEATRYAQLQNARKSSH